MKTNNTKKKTPLWSQCVCFLFIVFSPLLLVLILPFIILRMLTSFVYLFYDKYELMDSADTIWCVEPEEKKMKKNIISILMVVDFVPKFEGDTLLTAMRAIVLEAYGGPEYWKFWAGRGRGLAYTYWIKQDIDVEDCVKPMPSEIKTKEEVESYMVERSNDTMVRGLAVYTGSHKIEGGYPVLFMIHHSSGDGNALLKSLVQSLSHVKKNHRVVTKPAAPSILEILGAAPAIIMRNINVKETTLTSATGQRFAASRIISTSNVEKIKKAKDENHGLGFAGVILYAIADSLKPFLEKTGRQEDSAQIVLTVALPSKTMSNRFSFTVLKLPINHPRVPTIKEGMSLMAEDIQTYLLIQSTVRFFPYQIVNLMLNMFQIGIAFSNIPGPEAVCLGDHPLKALTFWVPLRYDIGLGISTLTYDNKLHLGLMADKALVPNQKELDDMIDRIVNILENLENEDELSIKESNGPKNPIYS